MMLICVSRAADGDAISSSICSGVCTIRAMPLADGTTFAGYTIVRRLGSGGMGEVYLAEHPRLPRRTR